MARKYDTEQVLRMMTEMDTEDDSHTESDSVYNKSGSDSELQLKTVTILKLTCTVRVRMGMKQTWEHLEPAIEERGVGMEVRKSNSTTRLTKEKGQGTTM